MKGFARRPMSIKVTQLPDAERRPRHVAIGIFDGVHVGHRQVIDGADTVLTFEPHPLRVLHPDAAPKLIMPFEIKRDVIEGLGVEELVVIPFDDEFSTIPAGGLLLPDPGRGARGASGSRWGRTSASAPRRRATRRCSPRARSSRPRVVPLVEVDGEIVSSTRIRSLVAAGEVEAATRCLGAPFLLEGTVVEGDGRGPRRSASRPPTSCPPTTSSARATASTPRSPTASRRPSTSASGRPSRPGAGCSSRPT